MQRQTIYFIIIISLLSCTRANNLSEKDYKWMPYTGNETLVFKSNTGKEDTIFLLKKDTLFGYSDQYSLIRSKDEVLSVFCNIQMSTQKGKNIIQKIFIADN